MIIAELPNVEDGLMVRVCDHALGFSVTIQDVDSGEFLSLVKVFPGRPAAMAFAESIAAGVAS